MPFLLKRLLGQFLAPLPLITLIFCLGWLIRHALQRRRLGGFLQGLAGLLFLAVSLGVFERALYRLEQTYPPFDASPANVERLRGADIVVLGQGLDPDSTLPVRFRDNETFLGRMVEAARIGHWVPDSRLIVSMAGRAARADKEAALAEYGFVINIPTNRLVMIDDGVDTETEARAALALTRSDSVILVTSASHLRRAIPLFEHAAQARPGGTNGLFRLIPAPAAYQVHTPAPEFSWYRLPLPNSRFCLNAGAFLHEQYGRLYESIRSWLAALQSRQ